MTQAQIEAALLEADMIIRRMDEDETWLWPDDLRDAVSRSLGRTALTAAQVGEPVDYVDLIGKREIEWKAAAEDHVDEIERLKADLAATIERCAQVAIDETKDGHLASVGLAIAAAIRKLKDAP